MNMIDTTESKHNHCVSGAELLSVCVCISTFVFQTVLPDRLNDQYEALSGEHKVI